MRIKAVLPALAAEIAKFRNPIAITLTFKRGVRLYRKEGPRKVYTGEYEAITEASAEKAVKRFRNRLARRVYARREVRAGKVVPMISVVEQTADGRPHYHIVADIPGDDIGSTEHLIGDLWAKEPFGYEEIKVEAMYGDYWLSYMLKSINDLSASYRGIDWENSSIFEAQKAA